MLFFEPLSPSCCLGELEKKSKNQGSQRMHMKQWFVLTWFYYFFDLYKIKLKMRSTITSKMATKYITQFSSIPENNPLIITAVMMYFTISKHNFANSLRILLSLYFLAQPLQPWQPWPNSLRKRRSTRCERRSCKCSMSTWRNTSLMKACCNMSRASASEMPRWRI